MKKELLMASALATTLGYAASANAWKASWSGSQKFGFEAEDADSSSSDTTWNNVNLPNLSVSVSEVSDSGHTYAAGFSVLSENSFTTTASDLSITLANDGGKLTIGGGGAADSQTVSIPGASGEQGLTRSTSNQAPGDIDEDNPHGNIGFNYQTKADFMATGLQASISFANDDNSSAGTVDTSYGIGVSYATTAGDADVTVSAGFGEADDGYSASDKSKDMNEVTIIGATVAQGDLTLGAGYSTSERNRHTAAVADAFSNPTVDVGGGTTSSTMSVKASTTATNTAVTDSTYVGFGLSYVMSDDLTVAASYGSGEAKVGANAVEDSYEFINVSAALTLAPGVTGYLGFKDQEEDDGGATASKNSASSGTAWFIGATVSF